MKKFIFIIACLFLLSGCDDLKDIWIVYQFRPHHCFEIENNSLKPICQKAIQSYSYLDKHGDMNWPNVLLQTILYKDKYNGEVYLEIEEWNTSLTTGFHWSRYEDLEPTDEGYVCFLVICYVEDIYAVYNKENETVPVWVYSYTLDDLKRYNWVVPFPDETGTIKIEKYEYEIQEI